MQREHLLISYWLRINPTAEESQTAQQLIAAQLNWDYVIKLLERNSVTSIFAYQVRNLPEVKSNTVLSEYFEKKIARTVFRNLKLRGELIRVLQHFQKQGILAVPLKGPTLLKMLYPNIALRQMLDLDILIDSQQYSVAAALLLALGYQRYEPLSGSPDDLLRNKYHEIFQHPEIGVQIELHWRLTEAWRSLLTSSQGLSNVVSFTELDNTRISVFSNEFLFIYLCVHGYRHYWKQLKWLVDIAAFVNNDIDLDWEKINELIDQHGLENIVDMALLLAHDILGARIPADAAKRSASKPSLQRLKADILQLQFPAEASVETADFSPSQRFFFHYALVTPAEKRRLLIHQLRTVFFAKGRWTPNQADKDWIHLPKQTSFMYYIIRPIRLVYQYGKEQLRLVRSVLLRR